MSYEGFLDTGVRHRGLEVFKRIFRDFVFANLTRLWTDMNPDFFKGTVVEGHVAKLLSDAPKPGAGADMAVAAAK